MATSYPARASRSAAARPIPLADPVTSAAGLSCAMYAPAASGRGGRLVGAAVLALGRGGREIAGKARRAGLHRGRVAEHYLPEPGLGQLVRHDDEEVDHGHEDDEVDDRGNERAEIHDRSRIAGADFHAQADLAAREALDERVDDVTCECGDKCAEREGYDEPDRDDDNVTAHKKILEAPHIPSPVRETAWPGRGAWPPPPYAPAGTPMQLHLRLRLRTCHTIPVRGWRCKCFRRVARDLTCGSAGQRGCGPGRIGAGGEQPVGPRETDGTGVVPLRGAAGLPGAGDGRPPGQRDQPGADELTRARAGQAKRRGEHLVPG